MTRTDSPPPAATRADRMRAILTAAFQPVLLTVEDDSARHASHAGANAEGESHFNVTIVSEMFDNRSRVERSRMVHTALAAEFATRLHALSLSLRSPNEEKS
jgi:stress-induced morphogen